MEEQKFLEFKKKVCGLGESRTSTITKSLGVYDAYKWIRKHKWFELQKPVTEKEFYAVIRLVNQLAGDQLAIGNDINLPERMGRIELRKCRVVITSEGGKITTNLPVDWDRTLKLWAEDDEAYTNRQLVRMELKEKFFVKYNKSNANYNNQSYMKFSVNRELKHKISSMIKQGITDAFSIS